MAKQCMPYEVSQPEQRQAPMLMLPGPVNLGQHTLEVLEDQSVLVVDHTAGKEVVQLDHEESYRLLVVLQSVFASEPSAEVPLG
jgi:hypothetical protein